MGRIVLVHGAWHGAWCWDGVIEELHHRGIEAHPVELPLTGFSDDVATARDAIESAGEGVVVCAHSYGGAVVSQAAAGLENVKHIVFLAALQAEQGEDAFGLLSSDPSPLISALVLDPEGVYVDPARVHEVFYGDSDERTAKEAQSKLRPMSVTEAPVVTVEPAWKVIPSTYVVCTNDKALSPSAQRKMAARAGDVVEWATDHSPFLTRPSEIAHLLAASC